MVIDQAELERRLGSSKNLTRTLPDLLTPLGPDEQAPFLVPEENKKLSTGIRIVAGSLAHQMPAAVVAEELGLTLGQVQRAKYSKDPEIKSGITRSLERVQELAIEKMMQALGLMTVEKFENAPIKDLSIIAANMGRIIEKTRVDESDRRVQLIVYAPESRMEASYRVLDV